MGKTIVYERLPFDTLCLYKEVVIMKNENVSVQIKKAPEPVNEKEEIFEPVLGELVADDAFSFTLLSCHCSGGVPEVPPQY